MREQLHLRQPNVHLKWALKSFEAGYELVQVDGNINIEEGHMKLFHDIHLS